MRRLVTTLRTLVRRFAKGYGSLRHLKNPDLALLAIAGLFASMSHSIIVPLLPAYADSLGAGPVFIGLLFGAPAAVQAICSPLFGYFADRMARKPLICFGIALGAGSVAALGVASGPIALLALRGLDGLALAMQQPATTAYIGDQYADDERGGALGAFKSAGLVGVAVGPALGGALSLWGTLGTPFLVLGTVTVFGGVFLVFRLPRARPTDVPENETGAGQRPRLSLPAFRGTLTISMVALAASVFVSQLGTGAFGLAMVLAMPIGGTLADRWGRKPMLIVSKLVWAAVVCGLALATVPQIPPVLLLVAGVASAFGGPAMGALQYEVAPKGREATVLGIYSALASAGVAIGPVLGGWVVGQWGLVALFLTMGALWAADTESFHSTLSETRTADLVVLVVDASDPVERIREKLAVSHKILDGSDGEIITVLNKTDRLSNKELATAREEIIDLTDDSIGISTTEGTNIDELRTRIIEALPNARVRLLVPNSSEGMGLISWAYDHATVENVSYDGERATIDLVGRPEIVEQAVGKDVVIEVRRV